LFLTLTIEGSEKTRLDEGSVTLLSIARWSWVDIWSHLDLRCQMHLDSSQPCPDTLGNIKNKVKQLTAVE